MNVMNRGVLNQAASVATATVSFIILVDAARCQSAGSTPEELIRYLTHQTEERRKPHVFSCGQDVDDRIIARSLAEMEERAVRPLEDALDSIQQHGEKSPFGGEGSEWVLVAYAKVKGPASDARLQRMSRDRKLRLLIFGLDSAIALEQSITSHVSSARYLDRSWDCFHPSEPRVALDLLVLAWMRGDRHRFEEALGPRAKRSLGALLGVSTWGELWNRYWIRPPGRHSAVGYKFVNAAKWGEPWVTLETEPQYRNVVVNAQDPGLETEFKTRSGKDCGTMVIQFAAAKMEGNVVPFPPVLVDSPDLPNLLRTISACATE